MKISGFVQARERQPPPGGGLPRRAPTALLWHWLRFGGSTPELAIELAGLAIWLTFAVMGRRSDTPLWLGCVLHALWDAAHFGRVGFVPEWYAAMCIAADVGLGAFVLLRLESLGGRSTR